MPAAQALDILLEKGLRSPKTLTLAITGACNLKCVHCWVEAGPTASAAQVPTPTLFRLIEEFAALGGEGLRLTGGEPLCHPAWLELLQLAKTLGLRDLSLQTNAMLLHDDDAAALRDLDFPGLSIQISLDGAEAATHDLIRGKGAFRKALAGIRRLADRGLARRIAIFFTEMRHNLQELPAVLELAEGLGVGSLTTGALVLCGRAAEKNPAAPPGLDQYQRLLDRFEADPDFRARYARLGIMAPLEWLVKEAPPARGCAFVENPYLSSSGILYPCVLCHANDFAVTGVLDKHLSAAFAEGAPLWSSLGQASRSRAARIAECRACPERPTCAGGCPGRAWGSCGDLMAADDRCELRRAIYRRKKALRPRW